MTFTDGFGAGAETRLARGFVVGPDGASTLHDDGTEVLASAVDTGGMFSLFRATTPAGARVPPHVHNGTDECFVVLAGEYRITCGDDHLTAGPGSFVYLPRGIPHSYTVGDAPATKLILSLPGGLEYDDHPDPDHLTHHHGVTYLADT